MKRNSIGIFCLLCGVFLTLPLRGQDNTLTSKEKEHGWELLC